MSLLFDLTESAHSQTTNSIPVLILVLVLFLPIRSIVQNLVDRFLFRYQYNYRSALKRIHLRITESYTSSELAGKVLRELRLWLNPENAIFMLKNGNGSMEVMARYDMYGEKITNVSASQTGYAIERTLHYKDGTACGYVGMRYFRKLWMAVELTP